MRSKKSLKVWKCSKECENTSIPCEHLQKLLPSMDRGFLGSEAKQSLIEDMSIPTVDFTVQEERITSLRRKLLKVGCSKDQAEVLIDRFISNMTLGDIATKSGFVDGSAVNYFLQYTLSYLKSIGQRHLAKVLITEGEV